MGYTEVSRGILYRFVPIGTLQNVLVIEVSLFLIMYVHFNNPVLALKNELCSDTAGHQYTHSLSRMLLMQ